MLVVITDWSGQPNSHPASSDETPPKTPIGTRSQRCQTLSQASATANGTKAHSVTNMIPAASAASASEWPPPWPDTKAVLASNRQTDANANARLSVAVAHSDEVGH